MKKIIMTAALAIVAIAGAKAQTSDMQSATLTTSIPTLIALRPYTGIATVANNQTLSATVTNATDVLANNNFTYNGNGGYNGLAYRIYSNVTYAVSLQAQPTAGSNDQLNNYINYYAETLPSPQNAAAPYVTNGNVDHDIAIGQGSPLRLAYSTATPSTILTNNHHNTGMWVPPGTPYSPLDPANTDWAAFGIKFSVSPGFAVFPGTFTTNLTVTATAL